MATTREEWLTLFKQQLEGWFAEHGGWAIPSNTKVTCGWPTKGALSPTNRRLGECIGEESSEGHINEIFISPAVSDSVEAGGILVHELVHAVVGVEEKHHGQFKVAAEKLGLEGKMTSTHPGAALMTELRRIVGVIGNYPHSKITGVNQPKKQTTRLVAATCDVCGYHVHVTRKWLGKGAPICPVDPFKLADDAKTIILDEATGRPIIQYMSYELPDDGQEDEA